ncbi:MAG: RNA polymerase sigma factor [Bryobacterales bacterium]|nr:RNA polymerase sigma factor [Bryobacterales bacterium]
MQGTHCEVPNERTISDDVRMMLLVKAGHAEQMEVLVERHRRRLIQHLKRMVRNADIAEELAQDVFLSVFQARERYEPTAEFTTWLFRIATNRALKWIRRQRLAGRESLETAHPVPVYQWSLERTQNPERLHMEREARGRVHKAIHALPPRQRDAVLLHKFEGYDYNEVAERLGCSVSAVKSILFRTYLSLRLRLPESELQ